jgi:spermidine/putrescine transport system substrate-binding protein
MIPIDIWETPVKKSGLKNSGVKKSDREIELIQRDFVLGRLSRRQALRDLGKAGLAVATWPLVPWSSMSTAKADEAGIQPGPGGIPLSRPNKPVRLPLHGDPIKAGLKPEGGTFHVFNYLDYVDQKVINSFEAKYDCKVVLSTYESMDQCITRLATGAIKVDVTEITPERIAQAVAGKLLAPINHAYIPNLQANIWPSLQDPYYDLGSQYTVPYVVYTTGIGWRSDKIAEDISQLENPWEIFWQSQKYKGYVGLLNDTREALILALLRRGIYDVNTEDPALINQALADLQAMVPICSPKLNITDYQTLGDGSCWLHQSWSGNVVSCALFNIPAGGDSSVLRYWAPPKGKATVQNDCWAVLANTTKPVLAHLWLNHLLDSKVATDNFLGFMGYQPPQISIKADRLVADGIIPAGVKAAILSEDDLGPESLQEAALTPKGQALWQNAFSKFNAGG